MFFEMLVMTDKKIKKHVMLMKNLVVKMNLKMRFVMWLILKVISNDRY